MFQPRLGIAYDLKGDGKQVLRANAGLYYARIPGLNVASSRSTDGSRGRASSGTSSPRFSAATGVQRPAADASGAPFEPDFRIRQGFSESAVHRDPGIRARDRQQRYGRPQLHPCPYR